MAVSARLSLAVGLGAALGSVARHLCATGLLMLAGPGFPWGTLAANVAGSALIGCLATLVTRDGRPALSAEMRFFALVGFCGGFTTFSIFSLETLLLLNNGQHGTAATYVGASVALWLLAVWAGARLGAHLNHRARR